MNALCVVESSADGCRRARQILIHLRTIDDGQAYSEAIIDALVFIDDAAEMLENMAASMPELAGRVAQENGNVLPEGCADPNATRPPARKRGRRAPKGASSSDAPKAAGGDS